MESSVVPQGVTEIVSISRIGQTRYLMPHSRRLLRIIQLPLKHILTWGQGAPCHLCPGCFTVSYLDSLPELSTPIPHACGSGNLRGDPPAVSSERLELTGPGLL